MKQLITEKEVSQKTCLSLQTLRNHRHLGKGIPYIKIEYAVRYDPDDVESYLQRNRVNPQPEV